VSEDQESGDRGRRRREGGCGESGEDGREFPIRRREEGSKRAKQSQRSVDESTRMQPQRQKIRPGPTWPAPYETVSSQA
jgi:hypothetical protein